MKTVKWIVGIFATAVVGAFVYKALDKWVFKKNPGIYDPSNGINPYTGKTRLSEIKESDLIPPNPDAGINFYLDPRNGKKYRKEWNIAGQPYFAEIIPGLENVIITS